MSPFRRDKRDEEHQPVVGGPPPLHIEDQWFRPEPAEAKSRGNGRGGARNGGGRNGGGRNGGGRNGTGPDGDGRKATAAAAASASVDDAPTEMFHRPENWLADPPAAAPGPALEPETGPIGSVITEEPPKKQKKVKKKKHRIQKALWTLLVLVSVAFFLALIAYSKIVIPPANESATRQTSRVYYAGGQESDIIGRFGNVNRSIVSLDKVPIPLRDAVLAAENRSFYSDNGVSPKGMARALWINLRGGSTQGGSTITQQYVKNYYLTQDRTIKRKLREALLSIKIDRERSKDQILEDYLNTIYLGRGAYGVQAAAKAYFDKDVGALTVAESAVLASIVRSPGRYDPSERAGLANLKVRWHYVIDSMVQTGKLTPEQAATVTFPKFPTEIKQQSRFGGDKGYILTAVRKELEARGLTKEQIENGGLRIVTTLNPKAQAAASAAVDSQFPKTANKGLRVGLAAVQPKTGRIIAMYGGKDFLGKDRYAQVNTATVPIQPGSGLKPFTLAAALEKGYDLSSTFDGNSPLHLPGSPPVNNEFDQDYGSSVTLMKGLEQSINTVFVDATQHIGAATVRRALVRAGIPNDAPGLATNGRITLGIASIRPTEVADAYATLCGEGIHAEQHMVERVFGPNGGELPIRKPDISAKPVFDPGIVSDVIKAMENVVKNGTGTKAQKLGRPVAGKTGTHQDLTAWFNGCTPQLATSVVYFKGDGTKSLDGSGGMSTFFGGTYPTLTWTAFMKEALKGQPVERFKVAGRTADKPAPAATTNPYDTYTGFQGSDPTAPAVAPGPDSGPKFPEFHPGPDTITPAPSPTPTQTAVPVDTAEPGPSLAPAANCTNDPNATDGRVYDPNCPTGAAPAAKGTDNPPPAAGNPGANGDPAGDPAGARPGGGPRP
jgi:membrane peptidoglycan carboxypeptidase